MGPSPNYMAQLSPNGYQNNMTSTLKKLAESKMKGKLKQKELEAKRVQAAGGK